jgi:lipoprotein NlpI
VTGVAVALTLVMTLAWTPQAPAQVMDQAVVDFRAGRIAEAVAGFDRVAAAVPQQAPQLWQRGIALFYAGRFDDCRRQFESHRTVNPDDVENAAWHFLCVAKSESPAARTECLAQPTEAPCAY